MTIVYRASDLRSLSSTWIPLAVTGLLLVGCAEDVSPNAEDANGVSTVEAQLTSVPTGVACVGITMSGGKSGDRYFAVSAGTSTATLNLGKIPAGYLSIRANAYNVACPATGTITADPTWSSDWVSTQLVNGSPATIALVLRPVRDISVSADFEPFVTSISLGYEHSMVSLSDGTMRLWGGNAYGQLGNSTTIDSKVPVALVMSNIKQVSASKFASCALSTGGSVFCWGFYSGGQPGATAANFGTAPTQVVGVSGAVQLASGAMHSCAVTSSKEVYCWGNNGTGQLGDGTYNSSTQAVKVSGIANAVEVAAGSQHSCARMENSDVRCWGYNGTLQVNLNSSITYFNTPVTHAADSGATSLTLGYNATCFSRADATTRCIGANTGGKFATGSTSDLTQWTLLTALTGLTGYVQGEDFGCGIDRSLGIRCAGRGSAGRLGNASPDDSYSLVTATGVTDPVQLALGGLHACVRTKSGAAYCWGRNVKGQLGDGTNENRYVPTRVEF